MHFPLAGEVWHASPLSIKTLDLIQIPAKQWIVDCNMLYKLMDQRKMLHLQFLFIILWTIWNHRPKWFMRGSPPTHGNYSRLSNSYLQVPRGTLSHLFIFFFYFEDLAIWVARLDRSFLPRFHLSGTIPNTTVIVISLTHHLSSTLYLVLARAST